MKKKFTKKETKTREVMVLFLEKFDKFVDSFEIKHKCKVMYNLNKDIKIK
jgi:hypothetical protein